MDKLGVITVVYDNCRFSAEIEDDGSVYLVVTEEKDTHISETEYTKKTRYKILPTQAEDLAKSLSNLSLKSRGFKEQNMSI
tara:strand:+ start:212 stop:454 length:243 start_codon:yes stop_codon:yes gene_type:complete